MEHILHKRLLVLLLLSAVLFLFGNNLLSLTDPDEVFYAQTTKEMGRHNEWLTPYIFNQPQFEKPIFTFWMLKAGTLIFGENPFAYRFFPALFACLGVLAVYCLGLLGFANERRAFLAAFILATSAFYLAMGKSVFTDMIFTVLILFSLLSFYLAYINPEWKTRGIIAFYVFAALAVLTKGPLGLFIAEAAIVIFLLYRRELSFLKTPLFPAGFLICMLIAVPWYWYEIATYGQAFIHEFFYNDHWRRFLEAEHKGNDTWYFYPVTMLAGLFPWTVFLAPAFVDLFKRLKFSVKPFEYFLLSWVLVVFFVFQISHSKLASYILPMFPALALLTANFIDEKLEDFQPQIIKRISYVNIAVLLILAVGVLAGYEHYKIYVPNIVPAFWFSGALIALAGVTIIFLLKDKIRQAVMLLGLSLIPVFLTGFMIIPDLEPHMSMRDASSYLPTAQAQKVTVLTIKPWARGIAYYTNQDVAVIDLNGENYFSPHPIPILIHNGAIEEFLNSQPETFVVVKKKSYDYLKSQFADKFDVTILKTLGYAYILKIEPVKSS